MLLSLSAVAAIIGLVPLVRETVLSVPPQAAWGLAFLWWYTLGALYLAFVAFAVLIYILMSGLRKGANLLGFSDERLSSINRWPDNGEGSVLTRLVRYLREGARRGRQGG